MLPVALPHPVPLEALATLPAALDGRSGRNRQRGAINQLDADNDWQAIHCWLREFEGSPQTLRTYRKEAERLLLWAVRERQLPLSSLTREDFQAYQVFLADPQPASFWCGPRSPRFSSDWKPFQGPLSENSQRQALIIVNALLAYLVDAGYLATNPLSLIRRRHRQLRPEKTDAVTLERFLDQKTWQALKQHIAALPRDTPRAIAHYERTRFLFHFLYLLAPRASEVASHPMNSFREVRGKWWWYVLGKGSKKARVPVSDEMLDALMRYRRFLGVPALPAEDDTTPLLRSINGTAGVTANMVYRLVKATAQSAADSLRDASPHQAAKLAKASTHWFRHTAITHGDDAGVGLKYLNRSARHDRLQTTAIYQHAEDDEWHQQWQRHRF